MLSNRLPRLMIRYSLRFNRTRLNRLLHRSLSQHLRSLCRNLPDLLRRHPSYKNRPHLHNPCRNPQPRPHLLRRHLYRNRSLQQRYPHKNPRPRSNQPLSHRNHPHLLQHLQYLYRNPWFRPNQPLLRINPLPKRRRPLSHPRPNRRSLNLQGRRYPTDRPNRSVRSTVTSEQPRSTAGSQHMSNAPNMSWRNTRTAAQYSVRSVT